MLSGAHVGSRTISTGTRGTPVHGNCPKHASQKRVNIPAPARPPPASTTSRARESAGSDGPSPVSRRAR